MANHNCKINCRYYLLFSDFFSYQSTKSLDDVCSLFVSSTNPLRFLQVVSCFLSTCAFFASIELDVRPALRYSKGKARTEVRTFRVLRILECDFDGDGSFLNHIQLNCSNLIFNTEESFVAHVQSQSRTIDATN